MIALLRKNLVLLASLIILPTALMRGQEAQSDSDSSTDAGSKAQLEAADNGEASKPQGEPVTVNAAEIAERIRKADESNRDVVLRTVDANIEATEAVLARLRREGRDMKSAGRARFNEAYENVRSRESELRQSLREVRHALPDSVLTMQAQLAGTYESYAQAVEQVEMTIRTVKTASSD